jgi:hypothetical protein
LVLIVIVAGQANADGIFGDSYDASFTFQDALGFGVGATMVVAFDGTDYWSSAGGYSDAVEYAQYDSSGTLIATYNPHLDFRSIFTDATGQVYARQFDDSTIYLQTVPGTFVTSGVTLAPNNLDSQSSVVLNGPETEYVALNYGTVSRWDLAGNSLGTVTLSGFGSISGENSYPQGRGIAAAQTYWLTYDGNRTLSAWDFDGNRVGTTTLNGAGTTFDSNWSLGFANGLVFIVDKAGGTWRGYDVGLGAPPNP